MYARVSTHWSKHPHPKVSRQQPVEDEHKCWAKEHSIIETRPKQELSRPGTVRHYDRSQSKQSNVCRGDRKNKKCKRGKVAVQPSPIHLCMDMHVLHAYIHVHACTCTDFNNSIMPNIQS